MEWLPIETAPKDGTRILAAEPYPSGEGFNIYEARYCTVYPASRTTDDGPPKLHPFWWGLSWRCGMIGWEGVKEGGPSRSKELSPYGRGDLSAIVPTHWMPLPEPPPL